MKRSSWYATTPGGIAAGCGALGRAFAATQSAVVFVMKHDNVGRRLQAHGGVSG